MKKRFQLFLITACMALSAISGTAGETTTTAADQTQVAVTIYNQNLALVKDTRTIQIPSGKTILAFREVSSRMQPETALLKGDGLKVLEQNFEFDLLTPQSLLAKFVGQQVTVIKKHPGTGEETTETAQVLSVNNGVVLKMDSHIETGIPGRLVFPYVPANLRDRPTLTMMLESKNAGTRLVELSYLTQGMSWKADYVAELNPLDNALDISGWVTLTNQSGTSYENCRLKLVAGDIHQAPPEKVPSKMLERAMSVREDAAGTMAEEQIFEYHLYSLDRPTTIRDNQRKQVALLQGSQIPCKKEFLLKGSNYYYRHQYGWIGRKMKVGVFIELENTRQNHMGIPVPKGVVRVYKKDTTGSLQFIGEDRIDHTPENEIIRLKLGDAFDVTADKKQTSFRKLTGFSADNYAYEAAFEIVLKNAKKEPVKVTIQEPIPGDWQMISESASHVKTAANTAVWHIKVPAMGKTVLTYKVNVKI